MAPALPAAVASPAAAAPSSVASASFAVPVPPGVAAPTLDTPEVGWIFLRAHMDAFPHVPVEMAMHEVWRVGADAVTGPVIAWHAIQSQLYRHATELCQEWPHLTDAAAAEAAMRNLAHRAVELSLLVQGAAAAKSRGWAEPVAEEEDRPAEVAA